MRIMTTAITGRMWINQQQSLSPARRIPFPLGKHCGTVIYKREENRQSRRVLPMG